MSEAPSSGHIAVIGVGHWGRHHVRNFHDLGALRTVCDAKEETLDGVREQYPEIQAVSDFDQVLSDSAIQGVVVAAPAELHHQLARAALQAGKDVLVEKPLALTVPDGEELVALALAEERILMVGHILDYHPAVTALQELVRVGTLGKVQYVYSNRLNLGKVRREENILWSFAPHDISLITALVGGLPETVAASGGAYLQARIADATVTTMGFAGGVQAHIFVSWLHPYKEQRLVVVGSKGMAVFDDMQPLERKLVLYDHEIEWIDHAPVPRPAEGRPISVDAAEPLRLECLDFLGCIEQRSRPLSDGENGLRVLKVLDAAQRSLETDGGPVRLEGASQRSAFLAADIRVHPTATLDEGAVVGAGTSIWHYSHVMPGARLGVGCVLGQNVYVASDVSIGNNVKIQNNVSIYDGVVLEDDVFCGPSMVFTNVSIPRSHHPRRESYETTRICRGATLGANSTVVCGRTVGAYGFVGAGAVVTKDVPAFALVLGSPARLSGWRCVCGEAIPFDSVSEGVESEVQCAGCGGSYRRDGQTVTQEASE